MADEKKTAPETDGSKKTEAKAAPAAKAPAKPKEAAKAKAAEPKSGDKPEAKASEKPAAGDPKMVLRVSAKPKGGFRRCGVHHTQAPIDYPSTAFSDKQVEILKAEPNLVVADL